MERELEGKTALVTGASRGIGAAIALALAESGAQVIVNYNASGEKAEKVAREIINKGGVALTIQADVSDYGQMKKLFIKAEKKFAGIDILVNNAGIHQHLQVHDLPFEDWQRVIQVNLDSNFICSKLALPYMKKKGWGRIINISSVDAFSGTDVESHYAASKAGQVGFTKALALETAEYGITVNAIAPGAVETDMLAVNTEVRRRKLTSAIPIGRIGQPEDIAYGVLFLASPKASFITGQVLHINGGEGLY
jgi:3-oxoacyl-[acyl-carrier protein] reductase